MNRRISFVLHKSIIPGYSAIIFSKDRPLQLQALLQSMAEFTSGIAEQTVIYHTTDAAYAKAYEQLKNNFPNIRFVPEKSFREDLIRILDDTRTSCVFFLVDDIIFLDSVDFRNLPHSYANTSVYSLRLHPGVTDSYMLKQSQKTPDFQEVENGLLEFSWGVGGIDWCYPLSVDGHIFVTQEILYMIRCSNFKAPNSLEASLQSYTPSITKRKTGICFKTPRIVNFPLNRVQSEFDNSSGELDPREFLRLFNDGYEIDFERYEGGLFRSVHVEAELHFKKK
jgi:hypothetical protein